MPYPNDDYISVEEQLRRQQELLLQQGAQQPYAEDQGNIEDISTVMSQQMGSADYAELLRQGASMQRGGTTTHYSPRFSYEKGNEAGELPGYDYASGQRPGPVIPHTAQAGLMGALVGAATQRGTSYGLQRAAMSSPQNYNLGDQFNQFSYYPDTNALTGGTVGGAASGPSLAGTLSGGVDPFQMGGQFEPFSYYPDTNTMSGGTVRGEGAGFNPMAAGAGAASGMLTSYLLEKYAGADPGLASIAGSTVGGGVAGGVGATAGGAAVGAGTGAISGGIGGVFGMVAMSALEKYRGDQEKGSDSAARQFAQQYEGKALRGQVGFTDKDAYLGAPYDWMTQAGRDARGAGSTDLRYTTPDYAPSKWEAWVGGMRDSGYKMPQIYDATAYYTSQYGQNERKMATQDYKKGQDYWLSQASDQPTFVRDKMGTTKYRDWESPELVSSPRDSGYMNYMARHGGGLSNKVVGNTGGEGGHDIYESYATPGSEYARIVNQYDDEMRRIKAGEDLLTPEQRQQNWGRIEQDYEKFRLPWEGEGFEQAYQEDYGHMKQYNAAEARKEAGIGKPAKESWYTRHYGNVEGTLKYRQANQQYNTGIQGDIFSKGISTVTGGRGTGVLEGLGITQTPETRDLYGAGPQFDPKDWKWDIKGNTGGEGQHDIYGLMRNTKWDYEVNSKAKQGLQWGVSGNTGGEGGHDIMGWMPKQDDLDESMYEGER